LEAVAAAKVRVAVSRMEQGNLSNVEWCRALWKEYKHRKASTHKGK
jgi:hypothetical protein